MIVWGGDGVSGDLMTGGRYDPGTDSWIATTHHQRTICPYLPHGGMDRQ